MIWSFKEHILEQKTITEIRNELKNTDVRSLDAFISTYKYDERNGVRQLLAQAEKKILAYQKELDRVHKMLTFERQHCTDGRIVCGIDEAGRGPLAGPVVAAAVILDMNDPILYVNDSKKLSHTKREELFEEIMERAVSVGIGAASPERIDSINILQADYEAMREAFQALSPEPDTLLNDAVTIPGIQKQQISIIKGDAKSLSIAAASIVAKVTRDRLMMSFDELYPQYGFAKNKGYGTADHIAAIRKYGPCPIHRRSFIGNFI